MSENKPPDRLPDNSDKLIENSSNNLTTAFDILCSVVSDYQYLSEGIVQFLERYPEGCKCVSRCIQVTSDKLTGFEEEKNGILFVREDTLVFLKISPETNSLHETTHIIKGVDSLTIDGKKMIIHGKSLAQPSALGESGKSPTQSNVSGSQRVYVYTFDNKTNIVLEHITELFEMRNSCIKVKNTFFKPKKIKVVMLTIGSRGDVQPFVSLALGLMDRGYDVKIVTHKCFEEFVTKHGIDFHPLSCDPKELMRLCVANTMFSVNFLRESFNTFIPIIPQLLEESWEGCRDANILISVPTSLAGYHIAEKLQIPFFNAFTMPFTSTAEQQNVMTMMSTEKDQQYWYSTQIGSTTYNFLSNFMTDQSLWMTVRKKINKWRSQTLGLPEKGYLESNHTIFKSQKIITLYCYSSAIYEKPSDWSDYIHVTGYWRSNVEEDYKPPIALQRFLKNYPNPVLVSFGSIPIPNSDTFYKTFIKVLTSFECPVIICKGWSTTDLESYDHVFISEELPYDYILKHVKFMCHHGGAGTTASCVYNKKPMLVIPFFGDQFFWGKRVQELGIGFALPFKELNDTMLSDCVRNLLKYDGCQTKVNFIENKVSREDGIANAINLIELNSGKAYIPPSYIPDSENQRCSNIECDKQFSLRERRHHCRNCGGCYCNTCCKNYVTIPKYRYDDPVRICLGCYPVVTKDYL